MQLQINSVGRKREQFAVGSAALLLLPCCFCGFFFYAEKAGGARLSSVIDITKRSPSPYFALPDPSPLQEYPTAYRSVRAPIVFNQEPQLAAENSHYNRRALPPERCERTIDEDDTQADGIERTATRSYCVGRFPSGIIATPQFPDLHRAYLMHGPSFA